MIVPVTPLTWAEDLCSQDLDLLSTSRKLLVTRVQFAAWHHNGKNTKKPPDGWIEVWVANMKGVGSSL